MTVNTTIPPGGPAAATRPPLARGWAATRRFRPVLAVTVVLFVVFAITQNGFLNGPNLENLLTAVCVLWVVAMGMTFALLTAGADLSVGAIAALAGIFFAKIVHAGVPGWPAVLLTCVFGVIIGAVVNGAFIGRFQLSFFVVTLASMIALTGVVNLWSGTQSFTVSSPVPADLGLNSYLGLPAPIWIMIATFLIFLYVQRWTYFGRDVYAVGGSPVAARLSGIRTSRTIIGVYALSALCATVGSLITVGRIGVAAPTVDSNLPLQAIAAVLLGGTSLSGGAGGVGGTALGVLFIGTLQNGLSIAGVPSFWQQIVTGMILVIAVLGDRLGFSASARQRLQALTRGTAAAPADPGSAPADPG